MVKFLTDENVFPSTLAILRSPYQTGDSAKNR
ncbi:Uncharacterized [Moorella glycerini]|uniref:Uncharacterized protein n=1 Tax=Neomoorella stamsii TaxID=1266720 RepID=A0A9X7P7J9_9FIRM|nr:hypothetical protein MOST_01510 [Moorella stamsii]CEP69399.1 Uncharacterized [Moorella glycerini]